MLLAKVSGGAVVVYPYTVAQLRRDFPTVSFPEAPRAADLSGFGVVPVTITSRPAEQPGVVIVEASPVRVGGEWQQAWNTRVETAQELADAKSQALSDIDRAAEATRLRFITPGAGQSLEYTATEAEARAYLAAPTGDPAEWPWLNAERLASGGVATISAIAQQVVTLAEAWRNTGAEIKRLRRSAKLAVEAAATVYEVRAIVDGVVWPSP